jgi:long-chain acyl-CoA synthetase
MQPDGEIKLDTVGTPARQVEIKIADNGEVMYRGPGVFQCYYKNPEATAETKTEDGWVHTGDAGFFDEDGHLKIIDRAKDVGKLNSGAIFSPKYVENKLKFFPQIKEAVVFGNQRDYVAAFINIDLEAVGNWAEKRNIFKRICKRSMSIWPPTHICPGLRFDAFWFCPKSWTPMTAS